MESPTFAIASAAEAQRSLLAAAGTKRIRWLARTRRAGRAHLHRGTALGDALDPPPLVQGVEHLGQVQVLGGPGHQLVPLLVELGLLLRYHRRAHVGRRGVGKRRPRSALARFGGCDGGHTAQDSRSLRAVPSTLSGWSACSLPVRAARDESCGEWAQGVLTCGVGSLNVVPLRGGNVPGLITGDTRGGQLGEEGRDSSWTWRSALVHAYARSAC